MDENNKNKFFRKVTVRINPDSSSGIRESSEIQEVAKYIFSKLSHSYQYTYGKYSEDSCWIEIAGNTTGLEFILSRKETAKSKSDKSLDFADLIFDDCAVMAFNWLTECESRIEIAPPTPKEILLVYIQNKPAVVRKKIQALLPLVDNGLFFQAIRVTKGDPNSQEIIEALNYYNNLKQQNEKQD